MQDRECRGFLCHSSTLQSLEKNKSITRKGDHFLSHFLQVFFSFLSDQKENFFLFCLSFSSDSVFEERDSSVPRSGLKGKSQAWNPLLPHSFSQSWSEGRTRRVSMIPCFLFSLLRSKSFSSPTMAHLSFCNAIALSFLYLISLWHHFWVKKEEERADGMCSWFNFVVEEKKEKEENEETVRTRNFQGFDFICCVFLLKKRKMTVVVKSLILCSSPLLLLLFSSLSQKLLPFVVPFDAKSVHVLCSSSFIFRMFFVILYRTVRTLFSTPFTHEMSCHELSSSCFSLQKMIL